MEVKIIDGKYDQHIVHIFKKGGKSYFRDEELESDIPLSNYDWQDISEFKCPSCNVQWGDKLEVMTCPCLEDTWL